ncbi:RTA1 domain protein [Akanthomyces lecanii RCEF 1005]|uniref:RTA1 domain protein n=1 Tax=Akanthomyces lecanii RCEF 1005 TaxID=1081108 RepID=A0A168FWI5_CORDF|nr:RTA1 domain protein [Akanthomyces lecanii RCEF 1005]
MYSLPTPTLHLRAASASSPVPSCITAVPDKNGYVPPEACNANYGFYPKWEDNCAFAAFFGLTAAAHLAQAVLYKKAGINAFIYMVVSRLVYFLDSAKKVLRIRATWMAKGFVSTDMVCFAVQAIGGGLMAGGQDHPKSADLGKKIYMAGCGIQLACVIVFVFVVAAFYRGVLRDTRAGTAKTRNRWIQPLFWERIIFRLVEFSRGADSSNPMLRKEWYQLYLDGLPMLFALAALNLVHPALVLQGEDSDMPASKLLRCWRRRKSEFGSIPLHSIEDLRE